MPRPGCAISPGTTWSTKRYSNIEMLNHCRAPLSPNQMCEKLWTLPGHSNPTSKRSKKVLFSSGGEVGHQLYKEFGADKLDGRYNDPLYPSRVINSV